jgi:hypothetical protein
VTVSKGRRWRKGILWVTDWLLDDDYLKALRHDYQKRLEEGSDLERLKNLTEKLEALDREHGKVLQQHQKGYLPPEV